MEGIRDLISPDGTLDLVDTVSGGQTASPSPGSHILHFVWSSFIPFSHQYIPFLLQVEILGSWKPYFVVAPRWNPGALTGRSRKGRDSWPSDKIGDDMVELGDQLIIMVIFQQVLVMKMTLMKTSLQ